MGSRLPLMGGGGSCVWKYFYRLSRPKTPGPLSVRPILSNPLDGPDTYLEHIRMHETNHLDRTRELNLFSEENGRALSALVPEAMARQMRNLWDGDQRELLIMNERDLLKKFQQIGFTVTPQDRETRLRFWLEFNRILDLPRPAKMDMSYVLGRGRAKEKFYRDDITNPHFLAYLLCVPASYEEQIKYCLDLAMIKIQVVLDVGAVRADGTVDIALTEKIMRIFESLHSKATGSRLKNPHRRTRPVPEDEENPVPVETPEAKQIRLKAELEKKKAERAQVLDNEASKPVEGTV